MTPAPDALFGRIDQIGHALDFHVHRHGLLAGNLANADTPNYQPADITFRSQLMGCQLAQTGASHLSGLPNDRWAPSRQRTEAHHDGSAVEVELTQSQIAANRLRFEEGVAILKFGLGQLRLAANNGK